MNSVIVGPLLEDPEIILDYVKDETYIVACDQGTDHLFQLEIPADLYIGDFDSMDPVLFAEIPKNKLKKYPTEKDTTDFELALREALEDVDTKKVYCFGFLGGRIDHELANILLLPKMRNRGLEVILINDQNEIHYLEEETKFIETDKKYISFIPLEETVLTTEGLKYPMEREELPKYSTKGLSNEYSLGRDFGQMIIHEGSGFVIFSEDKIKQ